MRTVTLGLKFAERVERIPATVDRHGVLLALCSLTDALSASRVCVCCELDRIINLDQASRAKKVPTRCEFHLHASAHPATLFFVAY